MLAKVLRRIFSLIIKMKLQLYSGNTIGKHFVSDTFASFELEKNTLAIGNNVVFRRFCCVKVRKNALLSIGDDVCFNDNCNITARSKIEIGSGTLFGPNVVIVDHDHNYKSHNWRTEFISKDVKIGSNAWIGANCVILKGAVIDDGAVIGAGTVVRGHVKEDNLFYEDKMIASKHINRQ